MARSPATPDRDRRSLAQQLAEDEIIELDNAEDQDVGAGVTKFWTQDEQANVNANKPGCSPDQERNITSGILACDSPDPRGTPIPARNPLKKKTSMKSKTSKIQYKRPHLEC